MIKTIEEEIFQRCHIQEELLLDYGFLKENDTYIYHQTIMDDMFEVIIEIYNQQVSGRIIEIAFQEEYTNFRIKAHIGKYNLLIKEHFINILEDIKQKCTTPLYFISTQANRIALYIEKTFHDQPLFMFDDLPDCGVFKNQRSGLWYGIIMNIDAIKLGKESREVEILNLKLDENHVSKLLKEKGYYPAYHNNKKHWISIILDDSLDDEAIIKCIQESYSFSTNYHEWIISISSMNHLCVGDTMKCPRHEKIEKGHYIYFYDSEEKRLTYKLDVIDVDTDMTFKVVLEFNKTVSDKMLEEVGIKSITKLRKLTSKQKHLIHIHE